MLRHDEKKHQKLLKTIRPLLVEKYGEAETTAILRRMEPIYRQFLAETPFIGGKKNPLAKNLDMALPFFALYEATGRSLTEADIDALLNCTMLPMAQKAGRLVNFNRLERSLLLKPLYAAMRRMANKINANRGGAWHNTWGVQINPEGHDHGFAMTLVGCPLADFARQHGYLDVLPCLCRGDERIAAALHARLIRHHTVAEGAETCDYWYVGDRNTTDR